jgi:putative transposase
MGTGLRGLSVSHSDVGRVAKYIADQEDHHRKRTFEDEYQLFVKKYGLEWRDDKTVETVDESHVVALSPG